MAGNDGAPLPRGIREVARLAGASVASASFAFDGRPGVAEPTRRRVMRHDGLVTDRAPVSRWLADYEAAWRSPGTASLAGLFAADASYQQSPYELPVTGLDAIARMWEAERAGPDEVFTLATEILAVDGPVAVVRAEVRYGDPPSQEYRDLWVIRLDDDGRCAWFEEWPYWPERPFTPDDDLP